MSLEDLYREIILDHYRNPRNRGELPSPPAVRMEGFNPLCGDEVVLTVAFDEGADRVADIKVGGQGCSISQSSASMMTEAVKGRDRAEVARLIHAFKAMMSIHEGQIAGPGDEGGGASGDSIHGGEFDLAGIPGFEQDGGGHSLAELGALRGVVRFPVRIKCATLAWNTLAQVLDAPDAGAAEEGSE